MRARRFQLLRHVDVSGVSGTGAVAEGIEFTDGTVSLRWYGPWPTTSLWTGVDAVLAVHGHNGATTIHWIDPPSQAQEGSQESKVGPASLAAGPGSRTPDS